MLKKQAGVTLIELLITMLIFVFVILAISNVFSTLLGQFKQQSKIAETRTEGIVGLEMLRYDLEQAGFGLPWDLGGLTSYSEGTSAPENAFNDATSNPPRPFVTDENAGLNGSDILIIKATNVAINEAANKWNYIKNTGGANTAFTDWRAAEENFSSGDYIIGIMPASGSVLRVLVVSGGAFFTKLSGNVPGGTIPAGFEPVLYTEGTYLYYGIKPNSGTPPEPRMPFNRADYLITNSGVPSRCASGTGVLTKMVLAHADGKRGPGLPLLDCVADMQAAFNLDTDNNGTGDFLNQTLKDPGGTNYTADQIRNMLKDVRVFILAHDGQKDTSQEFTNFTGTCATCIQVGDGFGSDFDLTAITDYKYYRWKVYSIIATPYNLR